MGFHILGIYNCEEAVWGYGMRPTKSNKSDITLWVVQQLLVVSTIFYAIFLHS